LAERLLKGDYAGLDALLNRYQQEFEVGHRSDRDVQRAFLAFGGYREDFAAPLDAWVQRFPQSYAARVARGLLRAARGYRLRTFRRADDVPPERWAEIQEAFEEAREDLVDALRLSNSPSLAWASLFMMGMVAGGLDADDVQAALQQCPTSLVVRVACARALRPEWGGSAEALQQFVDAEAAQLSAEDRPSLESLPTTARAHYVAHFESDPKQALEIIREAARRYPSLNCHDIEGSILSLLQQNEGAAAAYRRALAREPDNDTARTGLAVALARLGKRDEAQAELAQPLLWGDPYATDVAEGMGGSAADGVLIAAFVLAAAAGAGAFFAGPVGVGGSILGITASIIAGGRSGWRAPVIVALLANIAALVLTFAMAPSKP
jgi:tetratricopeptide (TPR) repeat protein